MESEREYLDRRAVQERKAAKRAFGKKAREAHAELADRYEQRRTGSNENEGR